MTPSDNVAGGSLHVRTAAHRRPEGTEAAPALRLSRGYRNTLQEQLGKGSNDRRPQ